MLLDKVSI